VSDGGTGIDPGTAFERMMAWGQSGKPRKSRSSVRRSALLAKVDRAIEVLEHEAEVAEIQAGARSAVFVDPRQIDLPIGGA